MPWQMQVRATFVGMLPMEYRLANRLLVRLLLILPVLAILGVIWYYQCRLEDIHQQINDLNEIHH